MFLAGVVWTQWARPAGPRKPRAGPYGEDPFCKEAGQLCQHHFMRSVHYKDRIQKNYGQCWRPSDMWRRKLFSSFYCGLSVGSSGLRFEFVLSVFICFSLFLDVFKPEEMWENGENLQSPFLPKPCSMTNLDNPKAAINGSPQSWHPKYQFLLRTFSGLRLEMEKGGKHAFFVQ